MTLHRQLVEELKKTHKVIVGEQKATNNGVPYTIVRFDSDDVVKIADFIRKYAATDSEVIFRNELTMGGSRPCVRLIANEVITQAKIAFITSETNPKNPTCEVHAHVDRGYSPAWELVNVIYDANTPYLDTELDAIIIPMPND